MMPVWVLVMSTPILMVRRFASVSISVEMATSFQ